MYHTLWNSVKNFHPDENAQIFHYILFNYQDCCDSSNHFCSRGVDYQSAYYIDQDHHTYPSSKDRHLFWVKTTFQIIIQRFVTTIYSHFSLYLRISFLSLLNVFLPLDNRIIFIIKQQGWYQVLFSISTTVVTTTRTVTTITTDVIFTDITVTIPQITKTIPTSDGFIPAASQIPTRKPDLESRRVFVREGGELSKETQGRCSIGENGKQTHTPERYPQQVDCTVFIKHYVTRTIDSTASKISTIIAKTPLVIFTSTIFALATRKTKVDNPQT